MHFIIKHGIIQPILTFPPRLPQDEKALRNNRSYHTIDTNKAGVRFRNSRLRDLNERHMAARDEYAAQQKTVVDEIVNIAGRDITLGIQRQN